MVFPDPWYAVMRLLRTQDSLLRNDKMKRSSEFIRSFCRSSIESKRRKLEVELQDELDILTVAMNSGEFSDEDLIDQMMTFLAAGMQLLLPGLFARSWMTLN